MSTVFNDQDCKFDINNMTELGSITVYRDLNSDNEQANKIYVDDSLGEDSILRFEHTLETVSKYPLDVMFLMLRNFMKYKLQIWQ